MSINSEQTANSMISEVLDQKLVNSNVLTLQEGAELVKLLQHDQYTRGYKPAFQSTIGAHFRHVLEHYRCFFSQVADGLFCYDKRERDQLLECDAQYALETITELISAIKQIDSLDLTIAFSIEDEQTSVPLSTTVNRELLFLQSHSTHHYAIIGAMTRAFGNQPNEDFGVAIATRAHNENCADNNKAVAAGKGASCAQ